jgi:hypothetical protein
MAHPDLHNEAENCRDKAMSYLGKPEARFLLRVAREFDRLAKQRPTIVDSANGPQR